jgi:hypothetical protein
MRPYVSRSVLVASEHAVPHGEPRVGQARIARAKAAGLTCGFSAERFRELAACA